MKPITSSLWPVVAFAMVCLLPATVWSDTTRSRPSTHTVGIRADDGPPRAEVTFDAAREQVTVRVAPRHLRDVMFPISLRERLTVLENGVRQSDVAVDVEHAPISVAVLIEHGGRSHQFNESVASDAEVLVRPLLNALDREDRLAVFAYDDAVRTIVDFETPREQWNLALGRAPKPRFSESHFYDATLTVLDRLADVSGRKALLLFSSGIDTFSRAAFADVVARAEEAKVPIYVFVLGEMARRRIWPGSEGLLARVDWTRCARQLERLAEASGGRAYLNTGSLDAPGIYDAIIEEAKVRYVLTYAPRLTTPSRQRMVQVAVLEPLTRQATQKTHSARGEKIRVLAESAYTPVDVTAASSTVAEASREDAESK